MSGFDIRLLADEIVAFLQPIVVGVGNPDLLDRLLDEIGVVEGGNPALLAELSAIGAFAERCQALADESAPSFEAVSAVLEQSRSAFAAILALTDKDGVTDGLSGLGEDLAQVLLSIWLGRRHPRVRSVAIMLGLIQPYWEQEESARRMRGDQPIRDNFRIDRICGSRIVDLIRDPVAALKSEYLNPLATDVDGYALADKLFPRLQNLLASFGVNSRYGLSPEEAANLGEWAAPFAHTLIIYVDDGVLGASLDAGLALSIAPATQGDLGLVVTPFGSLNITRSNGAWDLAAEVTAGVDVVAWGRRGVTLLASAGTTGMTARASATLPAPNDGPGLVFGWADGTRLEIGGARLSAETRLSAKARFLALSAEVAKSTLVISGRDGDGFISSILPSDGLRADFGLGIGWSSDSGLGLRGSGGLEATYPVGLSAAGVTFSTVHVGLRARDGEIAGEISAGVSASIGPVRAAVERVGLATRVTFPDKGGNLGGADLALGFKAPSGVGLSIDAHGVLTGGGFLSLDPDTGNYGGVVQLSLHERIDLSGFGLIATSMPDGSRGFSLLVFITADGFQPIPLGFGFMLQAIGGMLGINRTFDADVLRSGLKSDSLAQLLFPRDPVANAPALLHGLAAAFPVREGSYLLGLLARITWFTPTLVQMDLALILEIGARTRLLVLGRIAALLPRRDDDLIRLNLDAVGVLDFDAGAFEADAVLVDSRLVHQFPITGSSALRARWGGSPNFVLAAGGFNPRFAAPAGFPQLERVAIALSSGKNPRLICDAYFAVTSNTVQFGSRVSLYAEALGFSVAGDLGFDALITLSPPHFIVDFHAAVQLRRGSHNLFKVTLDGTLEGPLPLRLAARATFEILWFSFSVHFDYTLADGPAGRAPPSIRLEDEVRKALADPTNWRTLNEAGAAHGVSLRSLPAGAGLVLDPLGQLVVQQQVAPLNTQRLVDTFGGVRVAGAQRFAVTASFDGKPGAAVQGAFAPARYFSMTDDDKLLAPSFDSLDAGFVLGDDKVKFDPNTVVNAPLQYDEFVLNPVGAASAPAAAKPPPYTMPVDALKTQRPTGSAARAPVRNVGRARFRDADAEPAATLRSPAWRVVQIYGQPVGAAALTAADAAPMSWSEGRAALARRGGGGWTMAPLHELKTK